MEDASTLQRTLIRMAVWVVTVLNVFTPIAFGAEESSQESICDAQLTNQVANCLSAKSAFLTNRNLTYAAAVASGAAGAAGVSQLRKNFAEYLTAHRDELIHLGAKQGQIDWAEDWKKDAAGARAVEAEKEITKLKQLLSENKQVVGWPGEGKNRFPPRLKEVNGVVYDIANIADVDISLLPEKFHVDNIKSSQVVLDEAIDQLKQGKPLDKKWKIQTASKVHEAWLFNNSWAKDHPVQGKSFEEMAKMAESHPDPKIRAEAKANVALDVRRIEGVSVALSRHARAKGAVAMASLVVGRAAASTAMKASAALVVGPIVGTGLLAMEVGGDAAFDPASCLEKGVLLPRGSSDAIPGYSQRVRDIINVSFERGCHMRKPEYTVDDRVLHFLVSSDDEKAAALKVPQVCEFYKGLRSSACSSAKVDRASATCRPELGTSTVYLNTKKGRSRLDVAFDATGTIQAIRGPGLQGYAYSKADESWSAFSVPLGMRRGFEVPASAWVSYDGQKSKMAGMQERMFRTFEDEVGWDIVANFGAIESVVQGCVNPNGPRQKLRGSETVR